MEELFNRLNIKPKDIKLYNTAFSHSSYANEHKAKGDYEKLEFLCLYHVYICGITRILNAGAKMKNKKIIIGKYLNYINNNFETFKSNKYIKYLDKNKKIVYRLINLKLYYIIQIIFKIKNR